MSYDIHPRAERRLRGLADDAADQFGSTILHNRVHEEVEGQHSTDDPLAALLDATERAYAIEERTDVANDPVGDLAFDAAETLNDGVEELVAAQIARACATIVLEGDDWTDAWDAAEIHGAQAEARAWLGDHLDVAERVGVLDAVREAAVGEW